MPNSRPLAVYEQQDIRDLEIRAGVAPIHPEDLPYVDYHAEVRRLTNSIRNNLDRMAQTNLNTGVPVPTETRIEPLMHFDYGTEPATPVAGWNTVTADPGQWRPPVAELAPTLHDKELTALKEEVASLKAAIHALINTIDGSGLY